MKDGKTAKTWKCSDCGRRVRFGNTPRTKQYDPPQRPVGPKPARLCYQCAAAAHCQAQLEEIRRRLAEKRGASLPDEIPGIPGTGDFFNNGKIKLLE